MKAIKTGFQLLLILLVCSCGSDTIKVPNKNEIITKTVVEIPKEITDIQNTAISKWDINTTLGEGIIWRMEEKEGSNDWSDIVVTNIFGFKNKIAIGEAVQIIPLRKELPTITLNVVKTTKRDEMAPDIWYEIELENIPKKYKEYWEIGALPEIRPEYPSNVIVVYPLMDNCTLLQGILFQSKDLPANISNNIIKGALDFDGDGLPDAILSEFCCKNKQSNDSCEYYCSETYIKVDNKWTMINSSQPM
tara:strand:+ start:4961 stop:5704 length:744 start_codon:yes stop_codon:yes gene_type:complete